MQLVTLKLVQKLRRNFNLVNMKSKILIFTLFFFFSDTSMSQIREESYIGEELFGDTIFNDRSMNIRLIEDSSLVYLVFNEGDILSKRNLYKIDTMYIDEYGYLETELSDFIDPIFSVKCLISEKKNKIMISYKDNLHIMYSGNINMDIIEKDQ